VLMASRWLRFFFQWPAMGGLLVLIIPLVGLVYAIDKYAMLILFSI